MATVESAGASSAEAVQKPYTPSPTPPERRVSSVQLAADSEPQRARWSNPIEFTITCIGYAVGLGNFWRFPFYCYQYGGGAFLVPYTLVLIIIGIPLFLLELYVGQKHQVAATYAWPRLHPAFGGLGYAGTLATFFVALYYNVIVAWGARVASAHLRTRQPTALPLACEPLLL